MKTKILACLLVAFAAGVAIQTSAADGILKRHQHATPPVCEPGFKIVEEIVYQDVVKTVCKQVQEYKKKWVYSTIDDPYCIQGCHGGGCDNCKGPYCRQLLVKRQILEPCPVTKCVTETIVEKVAVVVYTKVPCAPGEIVPPVMMPPASGNSEFIPAKPLPVDTKKK